MYHTYRVSYRDQGSYRAVLLKISMFTKYTAHISSNGRQFLTANKQAIERVVLMEVTMAYECTSDISSYGSHFLTARLD